MPTRGTLAKSSIFADEEEADVPITSFNIDMSATRALRDPDRANWKWPKTVAARDIRRRGRLSRQATIAQTEKEHTAASHFIKTSVKKLSPLTRQIMGKSLDDAIVQMRFSPKKAARAMLAHLYHTRNEAVVRKGMAPEEMYISQAWVGRGPFEKGLNHRARGRIDMLMLPYTSKSRQRGAMKKGANGLCRRYFGCQGAGHARPDCAREGGEEVEEAGAAASSQPPHLRTAAILLVVDVGSGAEMYTSIMEIAAWSTCKFMYVYQRPRVHTP